MTQRFLVDRAYLETAWQENVLIQIDNGIISELKANASDKTAETLKGALIAGMPNLHSHAFQRALAGLTEHTVGHKDTFWTWRNAMYKLAMNFTPKMLKAVASQLYSELMQAGYTSVAEFHYVHQPDPLRMSEALIEAALETGIRLTLLPVLYQQSDFNYAPPNAGQKHFYLSLNDYLALVEKLESLTKDYPQIKIGIAPHSLRAVSPEVMHELFTTLPNAVRHMHIAEQEKEVHDCLKAYGARPIEWLLEHFDVNNNWSLIHCTHMTASELKALAATTAVAGLCPSTEGNLGDGFFELRDYVKHGGRFGIGTDSNSSTSPVEELRLMEYVQRLRHQERNIIAGQEGSSGEKLYSKALAGGSQALGQKIGEIALGYAADFILLNQEHPQLTMHTPKTLLDAFVFSGNQNPIKQVMVAGKWIQPLADDSKFRQSMKEITHL